MKYPRPLCENPTIIFNRNAMYNILSIGVYYINGIVHRISPAGREYFSQNFPYKKFTKIGHSFESIVKGKKVIDWSALENSYCGFDRYGQKQYLFLAVPCGHCTLCSEKKQNDFVARVGFENQTSDSRPIMVTLTYDSHSLPFSKKIPSTYRVRHQSFDSTMSEISYDYVDCFARGVPYSKIANKYIVTDPAYDGFYPCVKKRDVQNFFKRLRINWFRSGISIGKKPLRYVCFAEYGTHYGRPHYHLILWNVPYAIKSEKDFDLIDQLKSDILSAWGMCQSDGLQCEVARDAAKYVGKYISKNLTKDNRKLFRLSSNRGGGIGALFLDSQKVFLQKYPSVQKVSYVDKWSGDYTESTFGSYALNRVFPSASRQIPDTYKQVCRKLDYLTSNLARVSAAFKQREVTEWCDLFSRSYNIFSSVIPSQYSSFGNLDKLDSQILHAPTFYQYIEYYDDIINSINEQINLLESITVPHPLTVLEIDKKRRIHNTLFERPDVTDDLIYSLTRSIRKERQIREACELF